MTAKDEKETRAGPRRGTEKEEEEEDQDEKKRRRRRRSSVRGEKGRGTEGGIRGHRGRSQYTSRCVIAGFTKAAEIGDKRDNS